MPEWYINTCALVVCLAIIQSNISLFWGYILLPFCSVSLISPNLNVKSIIFPILARGLVPKLLEKPWHSSCLKLIAAGQNGKNYPTIQFKFVWFLKLRVLYWAKPPGYNFMNLALIAVFWYHLPIGWSIWECKWNWYSVYRFSENQ